MRRWVAWIVGFAMLGAVIFVALHFSEARDFARMAERANGWWLFAALALQAATYVCQGEIIGCVMRAGGYPLKLTTLYQLSLAKLFIDQVVPSAGVSGTVVLVGVLDKRGTPRALISSAVVVDLVSCWAAYALGLALALAHVVERGHASSLIAITCAVFIFVMAMLSTLGIVLAGRRPRRISARLKRFRPAAKVVQLIEDADTRLTRSHRVVGIAIGYQLAILALDTVTMWTLLRAVGFETDLGAIFASFMISTVLRTVESVPGGLGAFEASSVLMLKVVGVPLVAALSATVLFRGLSFWLPMIPGVWLSRRLTRATPHH